MHAHAYAQNQTENHRDAFEDTDAKTSGAKKRKQGEECAKVTLCAVVSQKKGSQSGGIPTKCSGVCMHSRSVTARMCTSE
jgi:hypothetical protein